MPFTREIENTLFFLIRKFTKVMLILHPDNALFLIAFLTIYCPWFSA